jgi:Polyketide cyclase / dehydrase and lipid transport
MRSVRVTIDVPQSQTVVYDYLDVMANHEGFNDHMMRDWRFDGPERGVGAKAHVTAVLGGRADHIDVEVIEVHAPSLSVERNIGAGGRRVATGTYTLAPLPAGGTQITFEYAWQQAPVAERLAAPAVRAVMRRATQRSLERLAEVLRTATDVDAGGSQPATSGPVAAN